jgi:hypothetical protein
VHSSDVRVVERGSCTRFLEETAIRDRVRVEVRRQHFHSDPSLERRILGEIDNTHPTSAELLNDFVSADEMLFLARGLIEQCGCLLSVERFKEVAGLIIGAQQSLDRGADLRVGTARLIQISRAARGWELNGTAESGFHLLPFLGRLDSHDYAFFEFSIFLRKITDKGAEAA